MDTDSLATVVGCIKLTGGRSNVLLGQSPEEWFWITYAGRGIASIHCILKWLRNRKMLLEGMSHGLGRSAETGILERLRMFTSAAMVHGIAVSVSASGIAGSRRQHDGK